MMKHKLIVRPAVAVRIAVAVLFAGALALPLSARAQTPARTPGDPLNESSNGTAQVSAGPQYDHAGALWRLMFGDNWRPEWSASMTVPVLDLGTFAGGLTPEKSGGNQTRTLHMKGADGRLYVFRSVTKSVQSSLGRDLSGTALGNIIQDQNSANHPSAPTMADVVLTATGVLHPAPRLYVMPDDPRLGKFRKEYSNMLGHIELKPDDVPDGVEQFAHADKIVDADKLLSNLDESVEYRFDARAWLKARLVDALMGDFDRGADQWEFARFDKDKVKTFEPIPRDRDWAFMRSNGFVLKRVRHVYAKIGSFDDRNEAIRSVTFMTREFDRSHLVALPWETWQSVVKEIQGALTDAVIDATAAAQPAALNALSGARIKDGLLARRDGLPELAEQFFKMVNTYADVFAADGNERADIVRNMDGSITVRIDRLSKDGSVNTKEGAAFDRTFLPGQAEEVRVYMEDGNDQVIVHGMGPGRIKLRVVGGAGDDILVDSTSQVGERVEFYDASGTNRIVKGSRTAVDTKPYITLQPMTLDTAPKEKPKPRAVHEERRGRFQDQWRVEGADYTAQRTQSVHNRFWGSTLGLSPVFDVRDGAGIVIGGGLSHTAYGFRSYPYASFKTAHIMYATGAQRFGGNMSGDWRPANHDYGLSMSVLGSGFESQHFYGYGNDTPLIPERNALVMRDELRVESAINWGMGTETQLSFGPVLRLVKPRFMAGTPAALSAPLGSVSFGGLGARGSLLRDHVDHAANPHHGYRTSLRASMSQGIKNGDGSYGDAAAQMSVYIPLSAPTLALRVSGERAFGNFPIHEAAELGGRTTLRGYRWDRFSGDAAVFGNAELRAPITRAELLVRGDLGVILLADAGRVWMNSVSSGGWHHSVGGGLSFSSLSKAVSVVFAHGEENRVYLNLGLPF